MSKDKKQEPNKDKTLSEWQKRNQEYLRKKAEENLGETDVKATAAQKDSKSNSSSQAPLSEWQRQNQEYLRKKAEEGAQLSGPEDKEIEKAPEAETNQAESISDSNDDPREEATDEVISTKADSEIKKDEQLAKEETAVQKTKKERVKKKTSKPAKTPIASVHIWRAVTILIPSFLILCFSLYLLTPYSTIKHIEVEGNVQTTPEEIKEATGIRDSDYTFSVLLHKDKYAESIKSNHWIQSAKMDYHFPTNFTIQVEEFNVVAYYVSGEEHYPILSSGEIETNPVSLVSLPETFISVLFDDEDQIKLLISELAQVSPEIKQEIQKIELAPTTVTPDLLKITMTDTDEVLVPLSELSKKLPYYSQVKSQLSVPSVIDMEVGIYSYSFADKALEEARIKAREEAKKQEEQKKQDEKPTDQTHR